MSEQTNRNEEFKLVLWSAFSNSESCDEQSPQIFWAIEEGSFRAGLLPYHYSIPTARKEFECVRGCKIPIGTQYFKSVDHSKIKICARCMAMILYFKNVWDLPAYKYDYWDKEREKPHFDPDGTYLNIIHGKMANN